MMIDVSLADQNGPMDVSSAEKILWLTRHQQLSTVRCGKCTIKNAGRGEVQFPWNPFPGTYDVELEIHWPDDQVQTVPSGTPVVLFGFEELAEEVLQRAAAAEWLTKYLYDHGPASTMAVSEDAQRAGMDDKTLQTAFLDMSVERDGPYWRLPDALIELIDATPGYWARELAKP